jgi:hypothetical protein
LPPRCWTTSAANSSGNHEGAVLASVFPIAGWWPVLSPRRLRAQRDRRIEGVGVEPDIRVVQRSKKFVLGGIRSLNALGAEAGK